MNNLLTNIKIIFNCKFIVSPPKKTELIVYDQQSIRIISKIFKFNREEILKTRKEEINLFILLKSFFNLKFNYFDYLVEYIKYSKPKFVITSIDNGIEFYKISRECNVPTIFFQNGARTGFNDVFELLNKSKNLKKIKDKNYVNLMCTFNRMTANLYKKIVNGQTFISGSVLSNNTKISKNKKDGLIYISHYRPAHNRKTHKNEIKLIKCLEKYCDRNNLKFKILCKFLKNSKYAIEEINFFKKILYRKFYIIKNSLKRKSYEYLDQSKIVVSSGSTMGIESLGRSNRTVIINPFPNIHPFKRKFFGYFTKKKNKGFFWHNGVDEKKIFQILNNVKSCKDKKWHSILRLHENETSKYDYKNIKLKKHLIKFLSIKNIDHTKYLK